jgi:glycosyltransferase involved in cell wall biosynthesis
VDGDQHVCCRYRVAAFRSAFAAAGYTLELHVWPKRWWSRLALFRSLGGAEIVLLQRKLLQPLQLALLRHYCKTLIFDFDDAIFLRDSYAKKGVHSTSRLYRFKATLRAADAIVAGNPYLAETAANIAPARRISCIPTCIDPGAYFPARHEIEGPGVMLTWIGSASTIKGLESLRPTLETAGQQLPRLRLKLICDRFFRLQNIQVESCRWSEASEAADLASADIGISWLPDDPWSRGKCGLKILQYMAAGLPVVANPVGVQGQLVRHEENGLLASSPDEWVQAIGRLARNSELRRQLGRRGRERVASGFSVAAGEKRWLQVLGHLQGRSVA